MALKLKPVYALVGNDEASKHVRVEVLKGAFASEYGSLTVEAYDAGSVDPRTVLMSLMSSSILSGNRMVLVRSFEKWAGGKAESEAAVMSIALDYLPNPDPGTVLLLVGSKFPKKTKPWKALAAAVRGHAGSKPNLLEYDLPPEWEMYSWVMSKAAEVGLSMERSVAEHLISVAGTDAMSLYNEMPKLASYLSNSGKSTVSKGDIDILVMQRPHLSEFKLAEAVSTGDTAEAYRVLTHLDSKTASQLVYSLSREARMMTELSSMMRSKQTDAKMKAMLKAKGFLRAEPTDFMLRKFKSRASLYDEERCVRILRLLSEMDYSLKGGSRDKYDPVFALERLIFQMDPARTGAIVR